MEHVDLGRMAGRIVLVTGATSGIGKAAALGLARMGAHLAITGRDAKRTEGSARDIRAAGKGQVDAFVGNMSSQSEMRRLAAEALQSLPRIDVLLNKTAGTGIRGITADGLEHTFALSHLAPFLPSSSRSYDEAGRHASDRSAPVWSACPRFKREPNFMTHFSEPVGLRTGQLVCAILHASVWCQNMHGRDPGQQRFMAVNDMILLQRLVTRSDYLAAVGRSCPLAVAGAA